jgi:hypothetical protein
MKAFAFAIVIGLAACSGKSSPEPATPENTTPDPDPDPVAAGGCATDDDCVISCAQPDECCDQLCPPCEQAWLRSDLDAHEAWRGPACAATSCPVAKCMAPTEETIARCREGACVVERRPI